MTTDLRRLPSIDKLLLHPDAAALLARFPRALVVDTLRGVCDDTRQAARSGHAPAMEATALVATAADRLDELARPLLCRVLNATGVVLHTNLGRAPLGRRAQQRLQELVGGYSNLELDLESGTRGSRYRPLQPGLQRLSGASHSLVVNNCAAAMMLVVDCLARDREVVVSRGELIEIGGSFRVPEVLERGGARLVEVGTTNKTYIEDYRRALGPDTGLLLATHLSNFRMEGFTHQCAPAEVAALGREHGIPTCLDLGSGLISDLGVAALAEEPTVPAMVAAGFDLVVFSGDKLLGGPQAGIILSNRADLIRQLARHPLTRALRVDKLTVAALEATLHEYLTPEGGVREIPILDYLTRSPEDLARQARILKQRLARVVGEWARLDLVPGSSSVGGGSLPGRDLPTTLVRIVPTQESEETWASRLRRGRPAVMVRRSEGALLLDPRCLAPSDRQPLVAAFAALVAQ